MKWVVLIIVAVILILVLWRLGSKRYVLPCPSFLSWMVEMDNPWAKENQSAIILNHLGLRERMVVADVGCGPGRLTVPLSKKLNGQIQVLALDIQSNMLEKVKKKSNDADNITLIQGKIGEGKLPINHCDIILLVNVLGEIPEQLKACQEMVAALKSDGVFSVTETIFDPHFQRASKVRNLARQVGLRETGFFGKWFSYTLHFKHH
ncbi:MAG TPA: class I SAM-dependent methyltransferase [Gammaproteobacteria bacterium]|nr:class I SAM-dependent methyltransferase [Gammaproteobacteria bacterium]